MGFNTISWVLSFAAFLVCMGFSCGEVSQMKRGTPSVEACPIDSCGAPLRAPRLTCADGSVGGNTGQCLEDEDNEGCSWEFRECPRFRPCSDLLTENPCPHGYECTDDASDLCDPALGHEQCAGVCVAFHRGDVCGHSICAMDEECCNEHCGICVPQGGFCTQHACPPDAFAF